ncbi:DNA alkylation repair protein [Paenibacillus tuaregi]|uniref:DNA alkylation repair protein n=1 Tax=Paenibacillus tuaregi TaxID=1816681 RepID=UPI000838FD4E|nr:DNA alkylation repair protein [Paenibacillus tuaregi]
MEALKEVYSRSFFEQFVKVVKREYPPFDKDRFFELIYDQAWPDRELKMRIRHVADVLTQTLPPTYEEALGILMRIAPECRGFEYLFLADFVELNGLGDYENSIKALEMFTVCASSEFAVRPFILKDPDRMMAQMLAWSTHQNEHLRRLASEGCRPRLPWGVSLQMFKADPGPILLILDNLKQDSSEYVRKSVANNLNDISKDHPELVLDISKRWYGHHPHTDWIVRHACRSLLKQGNPDALGLFGLGNAEGIDVHQLVTSTPQLKVGEDLIFSFHIQNLSNDPRKLRIEYEIGFVKKNGSLSPKRFKLSEKMYPPGTSSVSKKHSFKPITTRVYYAGQHKLSVIINGREAASVPFNLMDGNP